jgi:sugar phosphate isomerase/epimerase
MKLSATVWPFKWNPPYEEAIKKIATIGYKSVELMAWNKNILRDYYVPKRIRALRELMDSLDLELAALHSITGGMASYIRKYRDDAINFFEKQVNVAKELGTKTVINVSHWPWYGDPRYPRRNIKERALEQVFHFNIPFDMKWNKIWDDYVETISKCCEIAENEGLRYAIEPVPFGIVSNGDAMLRLQEQVNSQALGINIDGCQLFPSGVIPHWIVMKLKKRVYHCHVSDNDGMSNLHWRPGTGKIDWEAFLRALKAINYDGFLSIELEDSPGASRPYPWIFRSPHPTYSLPEILPTEAPSTSFIESEYALSRKYMLDLAEKVQITLI